MTDELTTDPLVQTVGGFIDSGALIAPGSPVVAAVSGGADSVALLAVLRELAARPERAYRLIVAHLNHRLRAGAEDDARFVAELAAGWKLPCVVEDRDVPAEARRLGAGVEQAARTVRYQFLHQVAQRLGARYVATGHHADDNAETILYRILRGTALRGLAGMPACRPLDGGPVRLIRPLLTLTRRQIEDYCRRRGLAWRTDPTNADASYRRNFIRRDLLPLLRQRLNLRVEEALLRLGQAAGAADDYLRGQAQAALRQCRLHADADGIILSRSGLAGLPPVLAAYVMREALESLGAPMRDIGAEHLSELAALAQPAGPAACCLPGSLAARRQGDQVILARGGAGRDTQSTFPAADVVALQCPGRTVLADGREVSCQLQPLDRARFGAHLASHPAGVELLDADQICGLLVCRPRRAGDAFVPFGGPGRQSVSDFLTNLKLPTRTRREVLCICDELGIVYLAPLRIDDRVKVADCTTRVVRIEVRPAWPARSRKPSPEGLD